MSNNIFEKWNNNTDLAGLKKDVEEAQKNDGNREFEAVPHGRYEVKVDKMELKPTKKGDPMVSIWFTIIAGKYKKAKLFMNQVVTQGFQLNIVNNFLRSMETGVNIEFIDYSQYADMLLDVAEACDTNKLEFAIKYEDNKGYDKYTIEEVFEN